MTAIFLFAFLGLGNTYKAKVIRVIDGDTLRVSIYPSARRGPELCGKCAEEKALAQKAKAFPAGLLPACATVILSKIKPDKYGGRYDADVQTSDGRTLAATLIGVGLAREYHGDRRARWCDV